jgi:hypothetical protein
MLFGRLIQIFYQALTQASVQEGMIQEMTIVRQLPGGMKMKGCLKMKGMLKEASVWMHPGNKKVVHFSFSYTGGEVYRLSS